MWVVLEVCVGTLGMQVARSADFRRDGFDVHSDVTVSFSQVSVCVLVYVGVYVCVSVCACVCVCVY